jgi:nucleoside-diphosphate-sugar epimerase
LSKIVLILGVNGFIGHHLSRRILDTTDWIVHGLDLDKNRIADLTPHERFHFFEGDITINHEWIQHHVRKCDIVLPLVAIATPMSYVQEPLRVFELDFEANLPIVRHAVRYRKRLVFPSTSEVYGMCGDSALDPDTSKLVLGPIHKSRWIYSCSKQLMDRVIHAYGQHEGLDFTLFRPFNWIGPGLDSIHTQMEGSARVVSQFLGNIARGEAIKLVDGGASRRSFTHISDGLDALMKILQNREGIASGKVYNIGNPGNNLSIIELAKTMLAIAREYPEYCLSHLTEMVSVTAQDYYGSGYEDTLQRVPNIDKTTHDLKWHPKVNLQAALREIFEIYRYDLQTAGALPS